MKVPEGQNVVSQAVAQSTKSAMRGSCFRQTPDRVRRPWLAASNNAPRMSGRGRRPLRPACFEASFHGLSKLARFCVSIVSIVSALDKPAYIPRPIF